MGAFVQAKNQQNNMLYSVLSDKQGRYRIGSLPAGSYQIQIRAIGYKAQPQGSVKLAGDQNRVGYFYLTGKNGSARSS